MRLVRWMKLNQVSQAELSRRTGIDQSLISKHVRNERKPKGNCIAKYHEATQGLVTFEDWFPIKRSA